MIGTLHLRVLEAVVAINGNEKVPDLRLDGGTALSAFYLGHRQSEDLDFFGGPGLNAAGFADRLRAMGERHGVVFEPTTVASRGFARLLARDLHDPDALPVKVDLGSTSPFLLAPLEDSEEGIRIASFRDVAAGKLHAASDRFEVRDFIDFHAILERPGQDGRRVDDNIRRARFRALLDDVFATDPGMDVHVVGQGLARGLDRPLVSRFPLRMIAQFTDDEVQASVRLGVDECAKMIDELAPGT
ncbi:MAG TPA: nucleotidyl transferase AbiEii/AbiGii toxin family protein [Longimicrobium sp.]|nr:nucleotidyl transferase AbiEii/AbiGii toxin family protein [Longimicrobium sp.]